MKIPSHLLAAALALLVVTSCQDRFLPGDPRAPGTFEVQFSWRAQKPAFSGAIFVFGFVQDCGGVDDLACLQERGQRQIGAAGPRPFTADPDLVFSSVRHGDDRVVLVEFRLGNTLDAPVLYAGRSGRFSLQPGKHVVVPVDLDVVGTASAPDTPLPVMSVLADVVVEAGTPREARYVTQALTRVRIMAPALSALRVSNEPSLALATSTLFTRADLTAVTDGVPAGMEGFEFAWTLPGGCTRPAGCVQSVHARVTDAQGYPSPQVRDSVVVDVTPPSLASGTGPSSPRYADPADVTYVLEFDEPVRADATLVARHTTDALQVLAFGSAVVSPGGSTLSFRSAPTAALPDGDYALEVTATDLAGHALAGGSAPGFHVDGTPPVISAVIIPEGPELTFGLNQSFRVRFTVNEAVTASVNVGDSAADRVSGQGAGDWEFRYGVDAASPAGVQAVTIRAIDAAGNQAAALAPAVVFDFVGPTLTFAVVPVGRKARLGEVITVTIAANEALDTGGIAFTPPSGLALSGPVASGTTYVWNGPVPAVETTFALVANATDLAGNAAPADATASLEVDGVAPRALGLQVEPPRVRAGEVFQVRFTASEDLAFAPTTTFSNGVLVQALTPVSATGRDYVFQGTAPARSGGPDGGSTADAGGDAGAAGGAFYVVTVTMQDVAGNVASQNAPAPIEIDNVAPAATLQVSPPAARRGDDVRIIVSADEVLDRAPRDQVTPADPPRLFARHRQLGTLIPFTLSQADTPDANGITFTYRAVMTALQDDGVYDVLPANMVDVAGNPAVLQSGGATLTVDVSSPAISNVVTSRAVYSAVAPFADFTVEFDSSEVLADLVVTLAALDIEARGGAPCALSLTPGPHYQCAYTLLPTDAAEIFPLAVPPANGTGVAEVRISARDAAGNATFDGTTVKLDFDAPTTVSAPVVTPAMAGIGAELTFTLSVDEDLGGATPLVTVAGPATLLLDYRQGTRFVYAHRVVEAGQPGGDVTGTWQPTVVLRDPVGNERTVQPATPLPVDADRPVVVGGLTVSPARASAVQPAVATVVAGFDWAEVLAVTGHVVAEVSGPTTEPMTCAAGASVDVECAWTVSASDADGPREIRVLITDDAGNTTLLAGAFVVDQAAPRLVSSDVSPVNPRTGTALLKLGDTLVLNVALDEPDGRSAGPTLGVTGPAGVLTPSLVPGTGYTWRHVVSPADASGAYAVQIGVQDALGNTATQARPELAFTVDSVAPTVSAFTVTPTRLSRAAGKDAAVVAFDVADDRPFGTAPAPALTVAGVPVSNCAPVPAGGAHYQCNYVVAAGDTEGFKDLQLVVEDEAGNRASVVGGLRLDFSAPTLVNATVQPAAAKVGDTLVITVDASEPLAAPPALLVTQTGGAAGPVPLFSHVAGTAYVFTHLVVAGDTSGDFDVDATLVDPVDNGATRTGTAAFGFSVDASPPLLQAVTLNRSRFSRNAAFNSVQVEFDLLDNRPVTTAAEPTMTVGGVTGACVATTGQHWRCTKDVTAADTEGLRELLVSATDDAGNAVSLQRLVVFDFSAPALLTATASPALAAEGQTVLLAVSLDESLSAAPVLTLARTGGAASVPPVPSLVTGSQYVFQIPITATTTTGEYTPSFQVTDTVGNSATLTGTATAVFTADSQSPGIANFAINATHFSRQPGFDTVVVDLDRTDNLPFGAAPAPTILVAGVTTTCVVTTAPHYRCTWVLAASATAGSKVLRTTVYDEAGNRNDRVTSVLFDFSAPVLATATAAPALAPEGQVVGLSVTLDEALSAPPVVTLTRTGGAAASPPVFTLVTGSQYVFQAPILGTTTTGEYTPSLLVTDAVGNTATLVGPAASRFTADSQPPGISNHTVNAARFSRQPGFDTVVVDFDRTDNRSFGAARAPEIRVGGTTTTCVVTTAPHFRCTYVLDTSVTGGTKNLTTTVYDEAGNVADRVTPVAFDFQAPQLAYTSVGPSPAGVDDTVLIAVELDEDASTTPQVILTRTGGAATSPPVFTHVAGTTYLYQHAVTATVTSGEYDIDLVVTDTVGNSATRNGPSTFKFTLDSGAPVLSNVVTNGVVSGGFARFSRVATYNNVVVTFTASEAAGSTPTLQVGTVAVDTCSSTGGNNYACTHPVTAADTEGATDFHVNFSDVAGNDVTASGQVVLDFTAPRTNGFATRVYMPGATNPLAAVSAATVGTTVLLLFDTTEVLGTDPLVTTPAGSGLTWTKDAGASGPGTYLYGATLTAPPSVQGIVNASAVLTDLVGNVRTEQFSATREQIKLDTVAPVVPVTTAGMITYTRNPHGTDGSANMATFRLRAGPGAVENNATVLVHAGPLIADSLRLGQRDADGTGAVASFALLPLDLPTVWVTAVDGAGNPGPSAEVRDIEWKMSVGGKEAGVLYPNPTVYTSQGSWLQALERADSVERGETDGLAARSEGAVVTSVREARWDRLGGNTEPDVRAGTAYAYDATRGVLVLFGGRGGASGTQYFDDTWEWNGVAWRRIVPSDPEGDGSPGAREGASMAYDANRGGLVLFGGVYNDGANRFQGDTWTFNGVSWRRLTTTGVTCRAYHAMAYDEATRRVVLFGGAAGNASCSGAGTERQDTYAFNGAAWTNVSPASSNPSVRSRHALATRTGAGRVVLFGGNSAGVAQNDTHEWNGTAWAPVTATSPPGARAGHALTAQLFFNGSSPGVLMTGGVNGTTYNAETWLFDGAAWAAVTPTDGEADGNPGAREGHVFAWHQGRRQGVVFGGRTGAATTVNDTWTFASGSYTRRGVGDPEADGDPVARANTAVAFDDRAARNRLVLFGGRTASGACEGSAAGVCGETWEWTGSSWVRLAAADAAGVTAPVPRLNHALVFDDQANRVFLFGGFDGTVALADSWRWSGAAWNKLTPAASPSLRQAHAMAYDSVRRQVVLFGGRGGANCDGSGTVTCNGTWLFDSVAANWLPGPASAVPARRGAAMAFDRDRGGGRTVMFGGTTDGGAILGDTWEWNGTAWSSVTTTTTPPARTCASMTYDRQRQKIILVGGTTTVGNCATAANTLMDAWEFDGTNWRELQSATVRAADAEQDGNPVARMGHALAYDPVRKVSLLAGGIAAGSTQCDTTGGAACGQLWSLDLGGGERPAHTFQVPLVATGDDWDLAPPVLTGIQVSWRGGGVGDSGGGVSVDGMQLWAWTDGRFALLLNNSAPPTAPASISWDAAVDSPAIPLTSYASGAEHFLTFATSPRADSGRLTLGAVHVSDYVDVEVAYRRP